MFKNNIYIYPITVGVTIPGKAPKEAVGALPEEGKRNI